MNFMIDLASTWTEKFVYTQGSAQVCGATFQDHYVDKTFTVDHFAPFTWLQWQSGLDSAGTDESCKSASRVVVHFRRMESSPALLSLLLSAVACRQRARSVCAQGVIAALTLHHVLDWRGHWRFTGGIKSVKVSTSMNPLFTPFYKSRFHLGQIDGWIVAGATSGSSTFSTCGTHRVLGGYLAYGKGATATVPLTHLPDHNFATVGVTWIKVDSWCVCARAIMSCECV
jgi:hypothetical protein